MVAGIAALAARAVAMKVIHLNRACSPRCLVVGIKAPSAKVKAPSLSLAVSLVKE
jgi:hypothetical protein